MHNLVHTYEVTILVIFEKQKWASSQSRAYLLLIGFIVCFQDFYDVTNYYVHV